MKTSELDYNLPTELIATAPVEPRDSARLLLLDRLSGELKDNYFGELVDTLGPNDVLVLNNSKVIPARLFANVIGNVRGHEVLLVKNVHHSTPSSWSREGAVWECWIRNGRKLKVGETLIFENKLSAKYVRREEDIFFLEFSKSGVQLYQTLYQIGEMPIPPYISRARNVAASSQYPVASTLETSEARGTKHEADIVDYQTVYAKTEGSVAAPTAGLHFTDELLVNLSKKGVQIECVTLHVGLGTFQPIDSENIEDFHIHSEYYEIDPDTATRLNLAKAAGKRIIAVGTTTVRVLESAATVGLQLPASSLPGRHEVSPRAGEARGAHLEARKGETSIYIYPGYEYKFVDAMITNFHLPKSSLLLLVSAFAGTENVKNAYAHAIQMKYRFYSYGDAMFIS